MSVQTQVERLRRNLSDALTAIADKGVAVPDEAGSDDLADLIGSIQTGGSSTAGAAKAIYGVTWDGTSTTKWTRTDNAAYFMEPVPYVAEATEYGSPFDGIMPWAGMVRVTDDQAGELVAVPKFWYKFTELGTGLSLQVANYAADGFYVSPAHVDRGDGVGERDVVYVGRYHCADTYKSETGVVPVTNLTRSAARTSIHSLGDDIWQVDLAMRLTIQMLYLVEFADWDCQTVIGWGCGNGSGTEAMGATDEMPYHTGTIQDSRDTYGAGAQYRNIEGLWDSVYDWMDGCYYSTSGLSTILEPADFSDTENGTAVGTPASSGCPTAMAVSLKNGVQWIYPKTSVKRSVTYTTYVADGWDYSSSKPCLYSGGAYNGKSRACGLFCVYDGLVSYAGGDVGCRVMKLPDGA